MDFSFIYVAKTKALISSAVTAQLICAFVFAYAKTCFLAAHIFVQYSHTVVQMSLKLYLGIAQYE